MTTLLENKATMFSAPAQAHIAVVIPCFKVKSQVLGVLASIGPEVSSIYCVDDACPEGTAALIEQHCKDPRVRIIKHEKNKGVGGASKTGFACAAEDGADIIVKVDGDGQIDPGLIPQLVSPILINKADYVKGNRFFNVSSFARMPKLRLFGNLGLSFLTKLSTGYWDQVDPTNGFIAISTSVLRLLKLEKISNRYLFETDMLFRLNMIRAVVEDLPMYAKYGEEKSGISIPREFPVFFHSHIKKFLKRLIYSYFLRDFNLGSVYLIFACLFVLIGGLSGIYNFHYWTSIGQYAPPGVVMLAALPLILGVQMLVGFLSYDVTSVPTKPISVHLRQMQHKISALDKK